MSLPLCGAHHLGQGRLVLLDSELHALEHVELLLEQQTGRRGQLKLLQEGHSLAAEQIAHLGQF